ncbi:hypothetical protein Syun_014664 [Stephania yunnanensis]|uniref:Uncharacterized protein n=1 Tax=Stephania yunnanensis TaxID=152371 RepID=A0AAP0JK84_9MAGN
MSSSSRVVMALLDGDWRASLGDLVLFEEIWKWGFGFGGFWRWCSELELLSAGARAFCRHRCISPRRRPLCMSPSVPHRRRLRCPSLCGFRRCYSVGGSSGVFAIFLSLERDFILEGELLDSRLKQGQREFEEKFQKSFSQTNKVDSQSMNVGRAA